MASRVLIANRGEIACRIIKTAKRLGLETVAIFSDADRNAQHVKLADESVHVGGAPPIESYLNQQAVLAAAAASNADSLHPGYGFLSESASFAAACATAGIDFVGPPVAAIAAMGDKAGAKALMADAQVPVVPGYHGEGQSLKEFSRAAKQIGYPLLIKASAGGGGKGMRVVESEAELAEQLKGAAREAKSAFSDERLILEKYLLRPRHIEVQVLADRNGHCVHLWERDCSMQRRHQKVIEEAPAVGLPEELRQGLLDSAVRAAQAIEYVGAGTVEFIVEGDQFYFMEMNTRLQVEHPVTEMICNIDLVEWQFRVAAGESIESIGKEIHPAGHAIEARLYAEDPTTGYLPSVGTLTRLRFPGPSERVRVDTGVVEGDTVSVHYDPMLAKLIAWGEDRGQAIEALSAGLAATQVLGVSTNLGLLQRALQHAGFRKGAITTGFLGENPALAEGPGPEPVAVALAALAELSLKDPRATPWRRDGWRLNAPSHSQVSLVRGDDSLDVLISGSSVRCGEDQWNLSRFEYADGSIHAEIDGTSFSGAAVVSRATTEVLLRGKRYVFRRAGGQSRDTQGGSGNRLVSPMPGTVLELRVKEGDSVEENQVLVVVEAMKMEHRITAPFAGVVEAIFFSVGDRVDEEAQLLRVNPDQD